MASPVACSRTPDSCCWGLRVLTVPLEAAVSNQLATCGALCVCARACVCDAQHFFKSNHSVPYQTSHAMVK